MNLTGQEPLMKCRITFQGKAGCSAAVVATKSPARHLVPECRAQRMALLKIVSSSCSLQCLSSYVSVVMCRGVKHGRVANETLFWLMRPPATSRQEKKIVRKHVGSHANRCI